MQQQQQQQQQVLPENWTTKTSSDGKVYYVNILTNDSQWTFPTSPAKVQVRKAALSNSQLPTGWTRRQSTKTGRTYYHNVSTNETSWQHPDGQAGGSESNENYNTAKTYNAAHTPAAVTFEPSNGLSDSENWKQAYNLVTKRKMLKKKMGQESKYQERIIFVAPDLSELCWAKPKGKADIYKSIPFEDILSVDVEIPKRYKEKKVREVQSAELRRRLKRDSDPHLQLTHWSIKLTPHSCQRISKRPASR